MSDLVNVQDYSGLVVDSDWAPAFAKAIKDAVANGKKGVFVPDDGAAYTVKKPSGQTPSIDLRGLTNFILLGEGDGSRIRLTGSGGGGSWNMIMIGGHCADVTVRGLYLDGDKQHLTNLDSGHTHTVQIGGMVSGGFAHRVRIIDCTMTDMDGDGVAIAALAGPFGGGNEVSVVDIIGCKFLSCHRSGVSNQRSAEFVRIQNCHFEGTGAQDIDFEPTGLELGTGPRRYAIIGNTMIHSSNEAAVTLSGDAGDIPARDNIFALNHVYGGRVGMVDTQHVLIFGNYIECGPQDTEAVLQMRGKSDGARVSHNHIVRVPGAVAGRTVNISSRAVEATLWGFDHTTDTIRITSHGRDSGTGPIRLATSGTLPTGLDPGTDYWLIRVDANTLKLAASKQNAEAPAAIAVSFSDNGTGRHTMVFPASSIRLRGFDHTTDVLTVTSHGRETGTGPVELRSSGTLPTGLDPDTDYWLIRLDADTLKLATSKQDALAGTAVSFSDDGTGQHRLRMIDHPRGVDVSQNRIHSHTGADDCTVLVTNGRECSFVDNELVSYAGTEVTSGVRFVTSAVMRESVEDWNISGNRIRGDAGIGGAYTYGVTVTPIGVTVSGVKVNGNAFRGCTTRVHLDVRSGGSYADTPIAYGNTGSGTDFAGLGNLAAVCISGNTDSQADYIYDANGDPAFTAADGSTARRRTGGAAGTTIYFREAGHWVGK